MTGTGRLASDDREARLQALHACISLRCWSREAALPVAERLWDADAAVALTAAQALGYMHFGALPTLPQLRKRMLELIGLPDSEDALCQVLSAICQAGRPAIPVLAEAARGRNEYVRDEAIGILTEHAEDRAGP